MTIEWLDAFPDSFDERDYPFRPRLRSVPGCYVNVNAEGVPILDQEPAKCTGYAAAGLVNLLLYGRRAGSSKAPTRVSAKMLYELARLYDEWEGEAYEGSSCRGVLKGWHHHGVCTKSSWQGQSGDRRPSDGWQREAVSHPMGAYYRVDRASITDLRLAILEAGAVLVSSRIHDGWLRRIADETLTAIDSAAAEDRAGAGLHAFLLVGYGDIGFVVMNSWGETWGRRGLAILPYSDWLEGGIDAWVVSLGAPVVGKAFESPPFRSHRSLLEAPADPDDGTWTELQARRHSAVFGKSGRPAKRLIELADGPSEIRHNLRALVEAAAASAGAAGDGKVAKDREAPLAPSLLVYFLSGLETEDRAIDWIRKVGPCLEQQRVTPFFVLWRNGLLEDLAAVVSAQLSRGLDLEELAERPKARDRLFEIKARRFLRPLWTEAQRDAEHANRGAQQGQEKRAGGLSVLDSELREISSSVHLHFAAHSAGVLPLAYLLRRMGSLWRRKPVRVESCTLLAPLCSLAFANRYFPKAVEDKVLGKGTLFCEGLQESGEFEDGIGDFYSRSLPVLISRALERDCDTPILCLESVWHPPPGGDGWNEHQQDTARVWRNFRAADNVRSRFLDPGELDRDEGTSLCTWHRSLAGDRAALVRLVERCRPAGAPNADTSSTMPPTGGSSK